MRCYLGKTLLVLALFIKPVLFAQTSNQSGDAPAIPDAPTLSNAEIAALPFDVEDQGPNHQTVSAKDAQGNVVSRYTELISSGFRQLADGSWVRCSPEIELLPNGGGAVAQKTRYNVIFSPTSDPKDGVVFDILTTDSKRIRGQCIGLAYTDSTGKSVFIAEIRDVPGTLVGQNEVYYSDCFDGNGIKADIRFRTELAAFHQDIILRSKLPPPSSFNLADDAALEIWSNFIEAPEAVLSDGTLTTATGADVKDVSINFGEMTIGNGQSFPFDPNDDPTTLDLSKRLPVQKSYVNLQNMQFLIESMPFRDLSPQLENLPAPAQANVNRARLDRAFAAVQRGARSRPVSLRDNQKDRARAAIAPDTKTPVMTRKEKRPVELAAAGYVADFTLNAGAVTNQLIRSVDTVYVTGLVTFNGLTIEGGAVIKFAKTNSANCSVTAGYLNLLTDSGNAVVFTAMDDDSCGEIISGSSGSPSGTYALCALGYGLHAAANISNVRIRYADYALYLGDSIGYNTNLLMNAEIAHCGKIILNTTDLYLRNVLIYDCAYAYWAVNSFYKAENVTFDKITQFIQDWGGNSAVSTNSIFCNVGSLSGWGNGAYNLTNNTPSQIFQTVGGGSHYLTDYARTNIATTTNISSGLATALKSMSTFPPIWLTNDFTTDTVLAPITTRDTTSPGFHYPATDYLLGDRNVTNATILLTNGVAVAMYGTNGLILRSGANFYSEGRPQQLNSLFRYYHIHEDGVSGWNPNMIRYMVKVIAPSSDPNVRFRFTRVLSTGDTCVLLGAGYSEMLSSYSVRDCQLINGLHSYGFFTNGPAVDFSNNYLWRPLFYAFQAGPTDKDFPFSFRNNLVRGGTVNLSITDAGSPWNITDNLFDSVSLTISQTNYPTIQNNAFFSTPVKGYSPKTLGALDFQSGPLGTNYYPASGGNLSSLINQGSQNATNAGLYHYTVQVNLSKETNSVVDIGFHYVATDSNGNPTDSDGDLVPDFLEDSTGNGTYEVSSDLSNWNDAADPWITGWGINDRGQYGNTPAGYSGATAFKGGVLHTVALYPNGTVKAWGDNSQGQLNVPTSLTTPGAAVAIGASLFSSAAVTSGGQVVVWPPTNSTPPAPILNDAVSVALGWKHGIALRRNGTVVTWGTADDWASTNYPGGLSGVKAIASGWQHNAALLNDGTVRTWGSPFGTNFGWNINTTTGNSVSAIAAGAYHTIALKSDGTVIAWGAGMTNRTITKTGYWADYGQSIVPGALTNPATANVIAIAAGGYSSMALRRDGTVVTWGEIVSTPAGISNIVNIGAGEGHCLAQRIGSQAPLILQQPDLKCPGTSTTNVFSVSALGPNLTYQWQFNGANISGATFARYTNANVQSSNVGNYHVIVSNNAGSVTSADAPLTIGYPLTISISPTTNYISLLYGQTLSLSAWPATTNCSVSQEVWTHNGDLLGTGVGTNQTIQSVNNEDSGIDIVTFTDSAGQTSNSWTVDVAGEGNVIQWGYTSSTPYSHVPNLTNAVSIAAGVYHSLVAREDGTVLAWGDNGFGQTNVPSGLNNVIAVAAGEYHSIALKTDGHVIAWGYNFDDETNVPPYITNVIAVAGGYYHSLALRQDGLVMAWGDPTHGQTNVPASLTNAVSISAGYVFNLAARNNGTVVAWGDNTFGQTNVPSDLTNAVSVAAGGYHALALCSNGTVRAWGYNNFGQTTVPGMLTNPATANVMAIAAGAYHSVALRNDGTVVVWGDHTFGATNTPAALTNVKLIAAGVFHTMAAINSSWIQYPIDVSKDLLLIYNTNSADSTTVMNYYRQHRPFGANANVLGIACDAQETINRLSYTIQIQTPVLAWLTNNPTKKPQYWVLFYDVPLRIDPYTNTAGSLWTNYFTAGDGNHDHSVSYELFSTMRGNPFVTHINMETTNDCKGYIDKLEFFGTNYSAGKQVISASSGGYGNTIYVLDNIRHEAGYGPHRNADGSVLPYDLDYTSNGYSIANATNALASVGISTNAIWYSDVVGGETLTFTNDIPYAHNVFHPGSVATNVAGYISWGAHSSLANSYATNAVVHWSGSSKWWIIETIESFNGQKYNPSQGKVVQWFTAAAFGGSSYSQTPVGAVSHVNEPSNGWNDPGNYFSLWATGKNFGITAWKSRVTASFQAVGDPLVKK